MRRASSATAILATASAVAFVCGPFAAALAPAAAQVVPDLVSRTALRVCSDPANLPFSNREKQGFENKVADIVAAELHEPVRYLWAPSGPGFVRNTLNLDLCDVIMGTTIGSEVVQSTNPYYRSTYVLVTPAQSPLAGIRSLDDGKLKDHAIGVFAATPPVDVMLAKGLMSKAKVFPLLVDHRYDSPLTEMFADLKAGTIEAAVVWGPLAGLDVKKAGGALAISPLTGDIDRPGFAYRITFGIRHDEPDWKHRLEAVIRARQSEINRVLVDYEVPLIDDAGHTITPAEALRGTAVAEDGKAGAGDSQAGKPAEGRRPRKAPSDFRMPGPAPADAPSSR